MIKITRKIITGHVLEITGCNGFVRIHIDKGRPALNTAVKLCLNEDDLFNLLDDLHTARKHINDKEISL